MTSSQNSSNGDWTLFLSDGTGTSYTTTTTSIGAPADAALANVDGDANLDLVLSYGGELHVYVGDGTGAFTDVGALDGSNTDNERLESANVDADGDVAVPGGSPRVRSGEVELRHGSAGQDDRRLRLAEFGRAGRPNSMIPRASDPPTPPGLASRLVRVRPGSRASPVAA